MYVVGPVFGGKCKILIVGACLSNANYTLCPSFQVLLIIILPFLIFLYSSTKNIQLNY